MKRSFRMLKLCFSAILSLALLTYGSDLRVFAADEENTLIKKGIYQFRQESYDEALVTFQQATKEDPKSPLAFYYLGLTYKRMEDYVSAKKYLTESLDRTPKIKGALIELIDLLYRLGEYDEAKKWIAVAESEGIRPAQSKFIKGLTLQKTGEYEEAIKAFSEAKELDGRLAQSASYQIGMCHLKLKHYDDAKETFKDVIAFDPYSEVGSYADKYVRALERKKVQDQPFHFLARFAFEYDSNVVLQPTDDTLTNQITDQGDTREVYDARADYTFKNEENTLSLKTGYAARFSKENDLGSYDYFGHNFFAQGNVSMGQLLVSFPLNYSYTVVDEKNYLSSISVGNLNSYMVTKTQMLQLGGLYTNDQYLRPVSFSADNRDANDLAGIAGWFWFFSNNEGVISLRYMLNQHWAEGQNWEFLGNRVSGGILYPVCDKVRLTLSGDIFIQDYENTNTVFIKKREDQVYTFGAALSYEFLKNTELQLKYTYVNDRSNVSIYEYDRHVLSAGVQYKF